MSATATAPVTVPRPSLSDGMGWRVGVSIVSVFGLASFVLLYLAFWASSYNWIQNTVVVLVSGLIFVAANGAAWASWGMRRARQVSP